MTIVDLEVDEARQALYEFGCPICGEEPTALTMQYVSAVEIRPCGHLVFPEDVREMVEFYRELSYGELDEDSP